jgi:hypothetical protein
LDNFNLTEGVLLVCRAHHFARVVRKGNHYFLWISFKVTGVPSRKVTHFKLVYPAPVQNGS